MKFQTRRYILGHLCAGVLNSTMSACSGGDGSSPAEDNLERDSEFDAAGVDGANSEEPNVDADAVNDQTCVNDPGNGATVVMGPQVTAPPGDNDSTFQGTAIDPGNADRLLIGTERNGTVLTENAGQSFVRLRAGMRTIVATNGTPFYGEIWGSAISSNTANDMWLAVTDSPGPVNGDFPSAMGGMYRWSASGSWVRANCGP